MNFYSKLEAHLGALTEPISMWQLHFITAIDYKNINQWKHGKRMPSDAELHKIAGVLSLKLDYRTLKAWWMLDKFPHDVIQLASELLKKETRSF